MGPIRPYSLIFLPATPPSFVQKNKKEKRKRKSNTAIVSRLGPDMPNIWAMLGKKSVGLDSL